MARLIRLVDATLLALVVEVGICACSRATTSTK